MSIHDDELTCQEVVELVTEYLENVLLPETRKRLEGHIRNWKKDASSRETDSP